MESAMEYSLVIVLKGAYTAICSPKGEVYFNSTGNPGMASGGMGDVLAGMLVALLGQGFHAEDAMKLGVYLHGFAGDRIAAQRGEIGLIASDIIDELPVAMKSLYPSAP